MFEKQKEFAKIDKNIYHKLSRKNDDKT